MDSGFEIKVGGIISMVVGGGLEASTTKILILDT